MSFPKEYWDKNYSEPNSMDGIGNAKLHAKYLSSLFNLHEIEVNSLVDIGFGMGALLKEFNKQFKPKLCCGVEPSEYIFSKMQKKLPSEIKIENISIENWVKQNKQVYDLGICNSVFQYIEIDKLPGVVQKLSKKVKYLYFTVPTDEELSRQQDEFNFHDEYAIKRSGGFYRELMQQGFHIVSSRVLESKYFFKSHNTMFTDLFYRL